LACPAYGLANYEAYANNMSVNDGAEHAAAALTECRRGFEARGIDTSAYHSAENAADIADLRLALGIDEWNLYGISYGTRLALTIMRDHPEGIRSVVIDSVAPPQRSLYVETPINGGSAYTFLFEACAADVECNAAYPDLERVFSEVVDELNTRPVIIQIYRPADRRMYDALMDGEFFAGSFFSALYSSRTIPVLPWVIYEARNGNYGPLQDNVLNGYFTWDGIATVMHYSSNCNDEIAFDTYEALDHSADDLPEALQFYFDLDAFVTWEICNDWDLPDPNPIENQSVFSDIPTLLLSGSLDPITPSIWADAAAETLENHFSFVIPGGGHGVSFAYGCAQAMLLDFLDDPSAEPESSCLAELGETPDF
ncbi:alpha/beta hydrolase, partial [candidate division KSB1 bacterium]|nr:alpha/beta hydrolase [candidate division KSB1 bacterium]